jgi:hypothetical protein
METIVSLRNMLGNKFKNFGNPLGTFKKVYKRHWNIFENVMKTFCEQQNSKKLKLFKNKLSNHPPNKPKPAFTLT